MNRKGLGLGRGKGYYNLAPLDHHIHSLSAKGVKTYYHVTLQKNLKPILKKGLLLEHKKNVKLSKKVNYVMDNLLDAGYFASKMKWEMEEQPIILQLNLTKAKIFDDKNTGAYSTWKEYHADIKPKQIKKVIHVTPEFWKEHMKRMDKKYEKATLGAKGFNFELTDKDYKDETYKSPVLYYNGKPVRAEVNMHYHTFLKYWSVGYQWNYKQRPDGSFQNGTPAIKSEYAIHSRKEARALAQKYMEGASVEDINKLDKFYQDEIFLSAKKFDYRELFKPVYQGRVMWNPKTGQILSGDESHSELLRQLLLDKKRDMNVNHWVRGIYMPKTKTFYVRHYFNPQSTYAEFTAKDFDISERMQKRFINKLRLPKDIKVEYNATNESLRQEGYIHV
jgi:hypothetical protein